MMEGKMLCNLGLFTGQDRPRKYYYNHLIQAQRRQATCPSQKRRPGPRGASACLSGPEAPAHGGIGSAGSRSSGSLSRPLVAIVARAWRGAFTPP